MRISASASVLALGLALSVPASAEDVVRTVQTELSGQDLSHFSVENLAGTMRISAVAGDRVTVVATVHAESQALADAVRLERAGASGGGQALRVRYPYDKVSTFRYRAPSESDDWGFGGWASSSTYDYDGHRVRIGQGHGTRLYADLEIHVPQARLNATFRNLAGLVEAEGLLGQLRFEVSSADLRLARLDGQITLGGSSGDIRARDIKGTWTSDFSSGDCQIDGFEGDAFSMHTTSGDAVLRSVKARRAEFQSTSGDVRLIDADLEELSADATSGDIAFEAEGARLKDVRIRTSSGNVSLRLPAGAAFTVDADQSSGDMDVRFSGGSSVEHGDKIVGYRHGSGGARIRVRTSSGDVTVSPG
ncbi:MAG TPA: DUF4097 family beta strand repeat-containing protein [Thermoanaerobaculia bacterium]|jgi:hypothetical protein|nr:DUF4097 family beta strand repeat-containing protein [Thermoanaerobaculia bacterium]